MKHIREFFNLENKKQIKRIEKDERLEILKTERERLLTIKSEYDLNEARKTALNNSLKAINKSINDIS